MKAEFIIKKHKSSGASLWVKGDLTVPYSKEFKDRLVELLDATGKGAAEISLKEVTAIDVTALQLMHSATQVLLKNERKLSVIWPDDVALNALIAKIGIEQTL